MFGLELIEQVSIERCIYKLKKNDKVFFDDFWDGIKREKNYENQLGQIQSILLLLGKGEEHKLPKTKFKLLARDKRDKYVDYEIKTKELRVYLFLDKDHGKIIVLGGKKNTQKKDIKKLRAIKKAYFLEKSNKK